MSQLDPSKLPTGVPKSRAGEGEPEEMEAGIALRGKNQTFMNSEVHCMAYTPPPLALKPSP